jgi:hypothetical protein
VVHVIVERVFFAGLSGAIAKTTVPDLFHVKDDEKFPGQYDD